MDRRPTLKLATALVALTASLSSGQDAGWGPGEATGLPDTATAGDHPSAWASRSPDGADEWLALEFAEAVDAVAVRVFESFNPGALERIEAAAIEGDFRPAWEGNDPTPPAAEAGVSLVPLDLDAPVQRLRLHLASRRVEGWNEIDAVALQDREGRLWFATRAAASSTFSSSGPGRSEAVLSDAVPRAEWSRAWTTEADALLDLWLKQREAGIDEGLVDELAGQIVAVQRASRGGPADRMEFVGEWSTSFGPMVLEEVGDEVRGEYGAGNSIVGRVFEDGALLRFRYVEAEVEGDGEFRLVDGGSRLDGRWRPDGQERWRPWRGERRVPGAGKTWLLVLEAPWEAGLAAPPYSFGGMLRGIFQHQTGVEVRVRSFTGAESFDAWCREAAWLDGRVVVVVASHATRKGVQCQSGMIGPEALAASLARIRDLQTVHFSACEAMAGEIPAEVVEACGRHEGFQGVSGYDVSVDWMSSALCEFVLLDLLLNRGRPAPQAAAELLEALEFSGKRSRTAIPAAHFRFVPASPAPARTGGGSRPDAR